MPRPRLSWLAGNATTDATLALDDGQELRVHRAVLALSSPVLHKAFYGPIPLPHAQSLPLQKKEHDHVAQLVAFCYDSDDFTLRPDNALPLLALADELCVDALKDECETYLCSSLADTCAADSLQWAKHFDLAKLKTAAEASLKRLLHAHLNDAAVDRAASLAAAHPAVLQKEWRAFEDGSYPMEGASAALLKLLVARGAKVPADKLRHAAVNGTCDDVKLWLELGADPLDGSGQPNGWNAVHLLAHHCDKDFLGIKHILPKLRAILATGSCNDLGRVDRCGSSTALHLAAWGMLFAGYGKESQEACLQFAELLVEHGAPLFKRDGDGNYFWQVLDVYGSDDEDDYEEPPMAVRRQRFRQNRQSCLRRIQDAADRWKVCARRLPVEDGDLQRRERKRKREEGEGEGEGEGEEDEDEEDEDEEEDDDDDGESEAEEEEEDEYEEEGE